MVNRVAVIACAAWLVAGFAAPGTGHTLGNPWITVTLADGSGGLGTSNSDRVDAIAWTDSTGTSTGNLVANGGPIICGDPQEFFGQSYDDGDGAGLYLVISGTVSKWGSQKTGQMGTAKTNGQNTCAGLQHAGTVKTVYALNGRVNRRNALQIKRTFTFNTHALAENYNLRAYVARFPLARFATVLVPDANGVVQTLNAGSCASACPVASWNGTWFADDDGSGHGIAVIRDASSTAPATVDLDNDSLSQSNLTSIVLTRPATGWSGTVTETEYLCFYDPTTWPAATRAAGKLPKGCQEKTP